MVDVSSYNAFSVEQHTHGALWHWEYLARWIPLRQSSLLTCTTVILAGFTVSYTENDKWHLINFYLFCSMWSLFLTLWLVSVLLKVSKGFFSLWVLLSFFWSIWHSCQQPLSQICLPFPSLVGLTLIPLYLWIFLLFHGWFSSISKILPSEALSLLVPSLLLKLHGFYCCSKWLPSLSLDEFLPPYWAVTSNSTCPNKVLSCFPDFSYWIKVSHWQLPPNKYKLPKAVKFFFWKEGSNYAFLSLSSFKFEFRVPIQEYYQLLRVVLKIKRDIIDKGYQHYMYNMDR